MKHLLKRVIALSDPDPGLVMIYSGFYHTTVRVSTQPVKPQMLRETLANASENKNMCTSNKDRAPTNLHFSMKSGGGLFSGTSRPLR